jgi:hypothetical protein
MHAFEMLTGDGLERESGLAHEGDQLTGISVHELGSELQRHAPVVQVLRADATAEAGARFTQRDAARQRP